MVSKAQNRATTKYKKANYKRVSLEIPKDQTETLQAVAYVAKESVNGFIKRAIQNQIEADARNAGKATDKYIADAVEALREKERRAAAGQPVEDQPAEDQPEAAEDQTEAAAEMDAEAAEKPQKAIKQRQPMRIS